MLDKPCEYGKWVTHPYSKPAPEIIADLLEHWDGEDVEHHVDVDRNGNGEGGGTLSIQYGKCKMSAQWTPWHFD